VITSQLQEDAAMIHSFSGEPVRTLIINVASVFIGVIVSFIFMWPFALLTMCLLPFMGFGAAMEAKMWMGEDDGGATSEKDLENTPSGIVVESLVHIRTIASLTIEDHRAHEFEDALRAEDRHPFRTNILKGCSSGLGQFFQMSSTAVMLFWGGHLLSTYPETFGYKDFLISMFSLLFSLSGLGFAMQGATDKNKANLAAERIFELTDRESAIDPLSDEGETDVSMGQWC
jgi:ATP-binding cassette subfamily B (MDR/TAP) protein 1